jgi:predicted dehydrogenase
MNILIIGLGSVGQRHLRNIRLVLKNKQFQIYALRRKFHTPLLSNKNIPMNGNIEKKFNIKLINNLHEIKKKNIDIKAAFVCSPTSYHIKEAIWLIANNINCFVEKPLSHNLKNISRLQKLLRLKKNLKTMMGYQLKFDPIINYLMDLKKIEKKIGKINFVSINHGENIKDFHPWEDYSKSYAANKHLGGGVSFSQIHEFEYFQSIFSNYIIVKKCSLISKVSKLKINVDDTSSHIFLLTKKKQKFVCSINLNFYQRPKERIIKLIGEEGTLLADLIKKVILISNNKSKTKIIKFNYKRNDLFLKEINYFFDKIIKNEDISSKYSMYNGIRNLRFVHSLLQAKK